jgi:hypothetical protein
MVELNEEGSDERLLSLSRQIPPGVRTRILIFISHQVDLTRHGGVCAILLLFDR